MGVRCRILDSRGEVPKQKGSLGAVNSIISSANGNYLSCKRDCSGPHLHYAGLLVIDISAGP